MIRSTDVRSDRPACLVLLAAEHWSSNSNWDNFGTSLMGLDSKKIVHGKGSFDSCVTACEVILSLGLMRVNRVGVFMSPQRLSTLLFGLPNPISERFAGLWTQSQLLRDIHHGK